MACHCMHGGILPQLNATVDRADRRRNTSACSCLAFTQAKFHCSAVGGKKLKRKNKYITQRVCWWTAAIEPQADSPRGFNERLVSTATPSHERRRIPRAKPVDCRKRRSSLGGTAGNSVSSATLSCTFNWILLVSAGT